MRNNRNEIAELIREARGHGWIAALTRNCHWRLVHKTGAIVFFGSSTNWRSVRNARAELRRKEREAVAGRARQ